MCLETIAKVLIEQPCDKIVKLNDFLAVVIAAAKVLPTLYCALPACLLVPVDIKCVKQVRKSDDFHPQQATKSVGANCSK